MNIIKDKIQKLRAHLGSDRIGINLLDAVTTIANDQRKRLASLEESSAADRDAAKALRTKAAELENQVAALKEELGRQTAMREAAQSSERAMRAQIVEPEALESMESSVREHQIMALLRNTQWRFKKLPVDRVGNRGSLYLEDFVKAFSYDEFAGLGMALAACAVMNFPVPPLKAEQTLRKCVGSRKWDDKKDSPEMARFVHWFRDCIGSSPLEDRVYDHMNLPKEQTVLHNTRGYAG
jgi:hypothetical protein